MISLYTLTQVEGGGQLPLDQSCPPSPRRTCSPLSPHNGQLTGGRTPICLHGVFAPRSKEGDNSPSSSVVGCLHGGPAHRCLHNRQLVGSRTSICFHRVFTSMSKEGDNSPSTSRVSCTYSGPAAGPAPRCLHSGQLIFGCDYTSKFLQCVFAQRQRRGGGVIPTPSSCARLFHHGPGPHCLHYRPLFRDYTSTCFHRVYAHPAVSTAGLLLIVSTTGVFLPF